MGCHKYPLLNQSYFSPHYPSIAHIKFTNIHQPFTDYFFRLPYSELLEKRLFRSRANRRLVCVYIYIYMYTCIYIPVVPHKAVAEVSKIGNYRRGDLLWCMDGRANPLMRRKVVVIFGVVALAASPHPQLQDVVWRGEVQCNCSCSCSVVVLVVVV